MHERLRRHRRPRNKLERLQGDNVRRSDTSACHSLRDHPNGCEPNMAGRSHVNTVGSRQQFLLCGGTSKYGRYRTSRDNIPPGHSVSTPYCVAWCVWYCQVAAIALVAKRNDESRRRILDSEDADRPDLCPVARLLAQYI